MNALSIPTTASTKSLTPLLGVLLALLISALDKAMATAAMPRAAAELAGFSRYPWTTTAHLLTSTIAMLVIAKMSDLYGRRRLYLWSTLILVLGSILCGAAGRLQVPIDGMNQLIFSRGILGIGDGGITALAFTFIADLFAPSKRGRYQGVLSAVYGLGSVVGLTLGGWITDHWSWRWAFWVTVPIGAAAIFTILGTVPNSPKNVQRGSIDWVGIVTLCGWLVPLLMAFGNSGSGNWLLAPGALMMVIFLLVEGRAQEPLVFLDLFRNRKVALTSVNLFLQGIAVFAVIVFLPVSLQGGRGTTAATSGLALSCVIAGIFSGNLAAGQLLSRTGRYRLIATFGTGCATIGLMLFSRIGVGTSAKGLFVAAIVCGLGFGSLTPGRRIV
jgi:MFS family permease